MSVTNGNKIVIELSKPTIGAAHAALHQVVFNLTGSIMKAELEGRREAVGLYVMAKRAAIDAILEIDALGVEARQA